MKNAKHTSHFFKLLTILLLLSNFSALAQKTTIWVVRHAEKEASAPDTPEPVTQTYLRTDKRELLTLAKVLKRENIKTIYVTQTKRSAQTAKPLAMYKPIYYHVFTLIVLSLLQKLCLIILKEPKY
jgi:2,3-bisphosphoglycerate-dependent phosphoglycerate mutase